MEISTNTSQPQQQWIVWWIVWAALQSGIFIMFTFLSPGKVDLTTPLPQPESLLWLLGFAPFAVSTIIRWSVLPRIPTAQLAFPLFVVGIALSEASCLLGLFVFPQHRVELFAFSVVGIFQFIPIFARRFFVSDDSMGNAEDNIAP